MDPSDRLIESLEKYKFYKPSHCEQNDNFGFKINSNVQNHSNGHNTSKVNSKISVKSVLKYFHFFNGSSLNITAIRFKPKFKCSNRIVFIFIVKDYSTMEFKSSRNSPTAWPRSRNVTNLLIYDFTCLILVTMKLNMLRAKLRKNTLN